MGYKRLNVAVNCETRSDMDEAQAILDELSGILRLDARDLVAYMPFFRRNLSAISEMFKTIAKDGTNIKSLAKVAQITMKLR